MAISFEKIDHRYSMPRVLHPSILETSSKRSNVFVSVIEVPPSVLTAANSERAAFPQFRKISRIENPLLAYSGGFNSSNCHIGGKRFLDETNGKPSNIEIVSPTQLCFRVPRQISNAQSMVCAKSAANIETRASTSATRFRTK